VLSGPVACPAGRVEDQATDARRLLEGLDDLGDLPVQSPL